MKIIQTDSTEEATQVVASMIIEKALSHPKLVMGLATGKTMIPLYAKLAQFAENDFNFMKNAQFFLLDEYHGLPAGHPSSFRCYIEKHVIQPLHLDPLQFTFPSVDSPEGNISYENKIKESGGIDLQLLGLGLNGHVGFNEPGSTIDSQTRIVKLASETLKANQDQFVDVVPNQAITMGIATILDCRSLLMLVTGKAKADVVKYLLNHHDDTSCPVTYLKRHPHFTLVLDKEAASKINLNI